MRRDRSPSWDPARDHLPRSFEEEQRKERKRAKKQRRREKASKSSRKEQHHQATFPVIVERSKASPTSRHKSRKCYSPEPAVLSHSGYESVEYSEGEEVYVFKCHNREAAAYSARSRLPVPKPVTEPCCHKKRSRKKKKGIKVEESHTHPFYPAYLEGPQSRNGIGFRLDSPYRGMDPIPARKSLDSMPGFGDMPADLKCIKKPKKLPPIDNKENRAHTDVYPFVKRF